MFGCHFGKIQYSSETVPAIQLNIFSINQYEPPHDKTNKMTVRPAKT